MNRFELPLESNENTKEKVLEKLSGYYAARERTWVAERKIEREQAQERNQKPGLARRIVAGLKNQGQKITEILVLLTALNLAGCYKEESTNSTGAERKITALDNTVVAEKEKKEIYFFSDEINKQIERESGVDLSSVAGSSDFDIHLQIPCSNGRYIVHIGQQHYIEGDEKRPKEAQATAAVQRDIEKLLRSLADKNIKEIFNEGTTEDRFKEGEVFYKSRQEVHELADSIAAHPGCFEELSRKCADRVEWYLSRGTFTTDCLTIQVQNIFKNKAWELRKKLESENKFDRQMEASFRQALDGLSPPGVMSQLGEDAVYLLGAEDKLEWEKVIKLIPAETKEGNGGIDQYREEMDRVKREYLEADFDLLSLEEIKTRGGRYETVKDKRKQAVFTTRENIALELIDRYVESGDSSSKIIPIIFGAAHDFEDNVRSFNEADPGPDYGLIALMPRDVNKSVPTQN